MSRNGFDSRQSPNMKNFLILALELEQNPSMRCPECNSRGDYCIPGARITKVGHEPNCNLEKEISEWIKDNQEIVENLPGRK